MSEQIEMFPASDPPPVEVVRICTGCGKSIITRIGKDHLSSEYSDSEGRCWDCSP